MDVNGIRRFVGLFAFILLACSAAAQQYSVTGGAKDPYPALDDSYEKIKVFLVYGMDNVQISYTSSTTSHKWYRYKTRVSDGSEEISSVQNGTTSVVANIEEGYGYYVVDESVSSVSRYYIWVFDYSKYAFDIRSLNISSNVDECYALRFDGDADIKDMAYSTILGSQKTVRREFEVYYETLEWDETSNRFLNITFRDTFDTGPFSTSFPPPLKDTEVVLTGDMFARHFEVEKSISMPYKAVAIEVHADTTIVRSGSSNMSETGESELHAPALIRFNAYANIPVASGFSWQIFRLTGDSTRVRDSNTEETEFEFLKEGSYVAILRVNNAVCSNIEDDESERIFKINITETDMRVPNAFSPGTTPGVNDIFKVKYKSVMQFQGWIFNRWGNEVFYWNDPEQGWDGKYRGKYVPPGAYYYLIEYTGTSGKKYKKKGDINVFRGKKIETEIFTEE